MATNSNNPECDGKNMFGYSDDKKRLWTSSRNSDGNIKISYCDDKQLEASRSNTQEIADYVLFDRIMSYNKENDYIKYQSTYDEMVWLTCRIMEFRRVYIQRLVDCSSYINDVRDLNLWWHENDKNWRLPVPFDWCNTVEFRDTCSKVMEETREFMGKTHEVYRDLPLLSLSFPFCLPITSSVYKEEDYVKNGPYNVVVNGCGHFAIQKRHDVFKHYNPFIMESPWKGPEALDGPIKDPGNNTLVNGPPKEKSS